MNPFQNIQKWDRKDFPEHPPGLTLRQIAERKTDRDLQKPVQQLLCDVHEECLNTLPEKATGETDAHWRQGQVVLQLQRLVGAQKRMVSLTAVTAFQSGKTNALVFWLTLVIVLQTFWLLWLTFFPRQNSPHPSSLPAAVSQATVGN
jgi:hypothetical protein